MWCKSCRQDVPGIASLDEGAFHCARCGARVGRRRTALADTTLAQDICDQGIDLAGEAAESSPTEALRQWADDEHLENVRRLLRPVSAGMAPAGMKPAEDSPWIRFDPPASHALRVALPQMAVHTMTQPTLPIAKPHLRLSPPQAIQNDFATTGFMASVAWLVVSLGLMGLVCGGILLGWAMASGRVELWKFGLPTAISGQCVLIVGLLLTYGARRLAHRERVRNAPVYQVPVAYAVPAESGNPSALLAELRGQIDRLSAQMSANPSPTHQAW